MKKILALLLFFSAGSAFAQPGKISLESRVRTSCAANRIILAGSSGVPTCDDDFTWNPSLTQLRITDSVGPSWTTDANLYNSVVFDLGSYPTSLQAGGGSVSFVEGVVSKILVPSSSTRTAHTTAFAGYCKTNSSVGGGGCVGMYGLGILGAVSGVFGANFNIDTNGFAGNGWGVEIDLNIPAAPATTAANVWGITLVSAAYQQPTGEYDAIQAERALGSQARFKNAFRSDHGAAENAVSIGISTEASWPIQAATNATPIVIHVGTVGAAPVAFDWISGDVVVISGVNGNTAANGTWTITVIDNQHFSLNTSVGNGAYTNGGTATISNKSSQAIRLFAQNTIASPVQAVMQVNGSGYLITQAFGRDFQNGVGDSFLSMDATSVRVGVGSGYDFTLGSEAHAALGSPANGTIKYCSDCTIANPCASGGSGAMAKRINSAWVCN